MPLRTAADVATFIVANPWRRAVLEAVRWQRLPDWAVGAGFIRSAVWDALHGYAEPTPLPDVDVLFFDDSDISYEREAAIEKALGEALPDIPWSARNQARMHLRNAAGHGVPSDAARSAEADGVSSSCAREELACTLAASALPGFRSGRILQHTALSARPATTGKLEAVSSVLC